MIVLGVDVGGTFTDLILADLERKTLTVHKTPSSPANPADGVVAGLQAICSKAGVSAGRDRQSVPRDHGWYQCHVGT